MTAPATSYGSCAHCTDDATRVRRWWGRREVWLCYRCASSLRRVGGEIIVSFFAKAAEREQIAEVYASEVRG